MASGDRRRADFEQPVRQLLLMLGALVAVGVAAWLLHRPIEQVFRANIGLNALIGSVFVVGLFSVFWQVFALMRSVTWIEGFAIDRPGHEFVEPPRLLRSLSRLLSDSRARKSLTSTSTRSILDTVATRIDESRDITRYIINLLIFLGLLGTFWGLSITVPAVVDTIRSLRPQEGGAVDFDALMSGLEAQLGGLGTAFASSLVGLAGSLVVGLLEVFANRAQNQFYRELEDWLASITRISITGDADDGDQIRVAAQLIEHNSGQIAELTALVAEMFARAEASERARAAQAPEEPRQTALLERIAERLEAPAPDAAETPDAAGRQVELLTRIADRIEAQAAPASGGGLSEEAEARLRSIDRSLLRLSEEIATGRQDAIQEIRAELGGLARALGQLAERLGRG